MIQIGSFEEVETLKVFLKLSLLAQLVIFSDLIEDIEVSDPSSEKSFNFCVPLNFEFENIDLQFLHPNNLSEFQSTFF